MAGFVHDDCCSQSSGRVGVSVGQLLLSFALGILREVTRSGPNTEEGRRGLGQYPLPLPFSSALCKACPCLPDAFMFVLLHSLLSPPLF